MNILDVIYLFSFLYGGCSDIWPQTNRSAHWSTSLKGFHLPDHSSSQIISKINVFVFVFSNFRLKPNRICAVRKLEGETWRYLGIMHARLFLQQLNNPFRKSRIRAICCACADLIIHMVLLKISCALFFLWSGN